MILNIEFVSHTGMFAFAWPIALLHMLISAVVLDLLLVLLLINRQTGGKKKKKRGKGGERDLWTRCSKNETCQDHDWRLSVHVRGRANHN